MQGFNWYSATVLYFQAFHTSLSFWKEAWKNQQLVWLSLLIAADQKFWNNNMDGYNTEIILKTHANRC